MTTKTKGPEWFDGWREKYNSLLVEGLTDGPTYVRLCRKECPMLDVEMALRPYVMRLTEDKIAFCGKLSVFPVKDTIKAAPASEKIMADWLSAAFPNMEFPKRSGQRVGTVIMTLATAPMDAGTAFKKHWADTNMVDAMLDWIEGMHGITVPDRKLATRALKEAYGNWLDYAFNDEDGKPGKPVSVDTDIAHGENILPFVKKKLASDAGSESPEE